MTEQELCDIEVRAAYATAGKWYFIANGTGLDPHEEIGPLRGPPVCRVVRTDVRAYGWMARAPEPEEIRNALFIAHARDDVPALCAEVRRLRALLGEQGLQD